MTYIPGYLVEESIRKAPKRIRLCGQKKENDIILEGRKNVFGPGSGPVKMLDLETEEKRECKLSDCENFSKLSDALRNLDFVMSGVSPTDVPPKVIGLYEQLATMTNTSKHVVLYVYHGKELTETQIKIAEKIVGEEEELRKRPIVTFYDEPLSPRVFGSEYVEALLRWCRKGLPMVWAPCPVGGATAPVTLAGHVVQGIAESLAGNVLVQLENPGTPFIFGFTPQHIDMRSALTVYGSAECRLMGIIQAQMSDYYQIPLFGTGGVTDSKLIDEQASIEATLSLFTAALSGQNLIHDVRYMESGLSASLSFLVICNEIIGYIKRLMKRTRIREETLALDTISEILCGGNYLTSKHTRQFFREEYSLPDLMDRSSWKKWISEGKKSLKQKAKEKAKSILKEHEVLFPKDTKEEIMRMIKDKEKKITKPR
jgi:trimethylamine--corrinoid protein Co-methyltransferase